MDEFTQRLLQKTNARKDMLEKRRKDAEARRAGRTPLKEHQPKENPAAKPSDKTFDKPAAKIILKETGTADNSTKNATFTKNTPERPPAPKPRANSITSSSGSDSEGTLERKKYRAPVPGEKREAVKCENKTTPVKTVSSNVEVNLQMGARKKPVEEDKGSKKPDDHEALIPGVTIFTTSPVKSPVKSPSAGIPGVQIFKATTSEKRSTVPPRVRDQMENGHGSPSLKERMKRLQEEQRRQAENDVSEIRRQRQADDHKLGQKEAMISKGKTFGSVVSRSQKYEKTVASSAVIEGDDKSGQPVPVPRTRTPGKTPSRVPEKDPIRGQNLPGSVCVLKDLPAKNLKPVAKETTKNQAKEDDLESFLDKAVTGPPKPPRLMEGERPKRDRFFKPLTESADPAKDEPSSKRGPETGVQKKNSKSELPAGESKRQKLQQAQDVLESIRREAADQEKKLRNEIRMEKECSAKVTATQLAPKSPVQLEKQPSLKSKSPHHDEHGHKHTAAESEPAKRAKISEDVPEKKQSTKTEVIAAAPVSSNNRRRPRVTEIIDCGDEEPKAAIAEPANLSSLQSLDAVLAEEEEDHEVFNGVADETLDCNLHEITFNIDFSKFDEALKEDRNTRFKKTFEETCKEVVKEKKPSKTSSTSSEPDNSTPKPKSRQMNPPQNTPVFQSEYTHISEFYATSSAPKKQLKAPEKPVGVKQQVQSFLEKAASQQSIVLQASQALNACLYNDVLRGSPEHVEAHRLLMLATERRTILLDEVQRLKTEPPLKVPEFINAAAGSQPCTATLKISDIQLPLTKDFMEALRAGKHDLPVYHFVCLVENGPENVLCSQVVSTNDATKGNFLSFDDKFQFTDLDSSFQVKVKLFCMEVKRGFANSTPVQKQKKNIFRRDHGPTTPQTPASPSTVFRKSDFVLVGSTCVTLPLVKAGKYSLNNVPEGHPLANFMRVKFTLVPEYSNSVKGFLTIYEDVGGYGAWHRRWCNLEDHIIRYWRYPDEEDIKDPLGKIELQYCTCKEVRLIPRDLCARPHTMALELRRPLTKDDKQSLIAHSTGNMIAIKYQLACDNKADREVWINVLNDSLRDWRAWNRPSVASTMVTYHNSDVHMAAV